MGVLFPEFLGFVQQAFLKIDGLIETNETNLDSSFKTMNSSSL